VSVPECAIIELPRIEDARGNLTFVEGTDHVPFDIRRAYWIYDVPGGAVRGGHAYATLHEFMIALSGSFDVVVDDGVTKRTIPLNRSFRGLYVPNMIWRQLGNFSTNAVCLILASAPFDEGDYLRDYAEYLRRVVRT
jgi:dTDP-4-dehydrorhamnose 3,5-epimerase-like enzyme